VEVSDQCEPKDGAAHHAKEKVRIQSEIKMKKLDKRGM
jgi:hypothetical protein